MSNTQPGKNPKTSEPQGTLKKGGNEGNKNGGGGKKGKPPLIDPETKAYAAFMFADSRPASEIAEKCDVSERTLWNWRKDSKFLELVVKAKAEIEKVALEQGIADKVARIRRLQDRWDGINQVFKERGEDTGHPSVPGWTTGLLCHEQRSLGSGDLATVVDIYKVDVGTIKEEREIAKQAAQELGQWTEKTQTTIDLSKLSDEDLEQLERIQSKLGT